MRAGQFRDPPRLMRLVQPDPAAQEAAARALIFSKEVRKARQPLAAPTFAKAAASTALPLCKQLAKAASTPSASVPDTYCT